MSPKGDKGIGHASSACTLFHLKTKRRHISYSNTEHMCLFSKTRSYDVHTWFGGKCQKICRLYLIWFSVTLRAISQSYNSGLVSGGITKNITEQEKKEGKREKRKPIKIKVQGLFFLWPHNDDHLHPWISACKTFSNFLGSQILRFKFVVLSTCPLFVLICKRASFCVMIGRSLLQLFPLLFIGWLIKLKNLFSYFKP